MADLDSLDLKLILSFANAYQHLYEKGDISAQQLQEVMQLVENYQAYTPENFEKKLHELFPESDF